MEGAREGHPPDQCPHQGGRVYRLDFGEQRATQWKESVSVGLIWWREGVHIWAIRAVGKLVRGRWGIWFCGGGGVEIFNDGPLVRIN